VIVDAPVHGGRYVVELDGFDRTIYRHRGPGRLEPGATIHTPAGWASITEIVADPSGPGRVLRARRTLPPQAVRPLCPEY
jgi:hypothetical protein